MPKPFDAFLGENKPPPPSPNDQAMRLECLKLANVFDPDSGSGDILRTAKQFADFVLEGMVPEEPEQEDPSIYDRRYGTKAFDADGDEQ